jgi:hypothetical protein
MIAPIVLNHTISTIRLADITGTFGFVGDKLGASGGSGGVGGIFGLIDTIDTDRPAVNNVKTARMVKLATSATSDTKVTKQLNGTFGRIPHIVISYITRFIGTIALSGRK